MSYTLEWNMMRPLYWFEETIVARKTGSLAYSSILRISYPAQHIWRGYTVIYFRFLLFVFIFLLSIMNYQINLGKCIYSSSWKAVVRVILNYENASEMSQISIVGATEGRVVRKKWLEFCGSDFRSVRGNLVENIAWHTGQFTCN